MKTVIIYCFGLIYLTLWDYIYIKIYPDSGFLRLVDGDKTG